VQQDNSPVKSRISVRSSRADLIREATIIVWDEFPAANVGTINCVDEICREVKGADLPFGGIPFIGVGDFRQVAPVVKGRGPTAAFQSSIKCSALWKEFRTFSLDTPIRGAKDIRYTRQVDKIGEDYENGTVSLPNLRKVLTIEDAIRFLYPQHVLADPMKCLQRNFLSPRNKFVDDFNEKIHKLNPETDREFPTIPD
jgi:hypothetical protein